MMKIYIGYDFDGNPTGVLLSDSREKAEIAWASMKDTPHQIEEVDTAKIEGIHGVVFLLTSKKHEIAYDYNRKIMTRIFKRGL